MDKIEDLVLTDDSVMRHEMQNSSLQDSLAQSNRSARLLMPNDLAQRLNWAGIASIDVDETETATVTIRYGSERWLFSQIIAAGGAIRIADDTALAKRLCDAAKATACPL